MAASSEEADAAAAALVDACGAADRDLAAIDGLVASLAAFPRPGAAEATNAIRGDWRLVWAASDEGVGAVGTGLHRVALASLEDIFLSLAPKKVLTSEVIRVLGPFPNVKNVLEGASRVSAGAALALSYTTVVDGTGKVLTDTQARDVTFDLVALTRDVLVLRCGPDVGADEWLVRVPLFFFFSLVDRPSRRSSSASRTSPRPWRSSGSRPSTTARPRSRRKAGWTASRTRSPGK